MTDPVQIVRDEGRTRLELAGSLGTRYAEVLHRAALEVAAHGDELEIDCTRVESFGIAALQILAALHADLSAAGRPPRLTGVGEGLKAQLVATGFARVLGGAA